jgi:3-oxoacyl-[acyl-carrier protein] reductase
VSRLGGTAKIVALDLRRADAAAALVAAVQQAQGRLDILVNNAGTTKFAAHSNLDALSAEDFQNIYAVNVIGAFQMVRACAPALKASGEGSVVNISSIAAIAGIGSSIAYAASKGALNTMTISLARALAPEIRVNAVCPGFVATPWFSGRFGQDAAARIAEEQAKAAPLNRAADGDEIARTVLFFCGPESRHITGEALLTDGGLHLNVMAGARR